MKRAMTFLVPVLSCWFCFACGWIARDKQVAADGAKPKVEWVATDEMRHRWDAPGACPELEWRLPSQGVCVFHSKRPSDDKEPAVMPREEE